VRLVELQLGAHVHEQRSLTARLLDLTRRERVHVHALDDERPPVQLDDVREVRRLWTQGSDQPACELVLVGHAEHRRVPPLVPDRGGHLEVHPGATAERPAEVARPHLACLGQLEQPLVERAEDPARPVLPVNGEVRPSDVAHEQAVTCEHRPRLVAALGVHQREGRVLWPVARCVKGPDRDVAELELPGVVERLVVVARRRLPVQVDRCPGRRRQPPVARHVVGVVVGLHDVLDAHPCVAGQAQVLVDVEPRIHHGRDPGPIVPDQVRGAAEVVVRDLAEEHPVRSIARGCPPVRATERSAA
jgi:hypothetical protein